MSGKGKGKRSKPAAENGASYGDGTTNGVGDLKKAKYENGNGHCKNGNGHFKNGNSANGGKKSSHLYLRSTLKDEGR